MGIDTAQDSPQSSSPAGGLPPAQPGTGEAVRQPKEPQDLNKEQKRTIVFVIIAAILVVALIVLSIVFLMNQEVGEVARIRDIFIIFMAVQSLLSGLALVVLMIQLARLINLLQNEVKPILDTTQETVSNLRGTTVFLGENLVEPVLKMNEYLAGLTQLFTVIGLVKRTPKNQRIKGDQ